MHRRRLRWLRPRPTSRARLKQIAGVHRARHDSVSHLIKTPMAEKATKRIAYIDWLRGFACLVMFQTHCYDSWLGGAAREGGFMKLSQLGGTFPAPLFLFLSGVSFA